MPRAGPQGNPALHLLNLTVGFPRGGEHGKAVPGWWRFDSAVEPNKP
ncbi:MAG: hypothetical protein ABSG31_18480 [Tepidisphaeraceae bacterium]